MNNTTINQSLDSSIIEGASPKAIPWRRWRLAYDGFNLSSNTLFTSAIWVIYVASRGYSPRAIGMFEMLFHISKFVAQVLRCIFADMVGRRKEWLFVCN